MHEYINICSMFVFYQNILYIFTNIFHINSNWLFSWNVFQCRTAVQPFVVEQFEKFQFLWIIIMAKSYIVYQKSQRVKEPGQTKRIYVGEYVEFGPREMNA